MNSSTIILDPVGGVAGDMFVASMLDLFGDLEEGCLRAANSFADLGGHARIEHTVVQGFAGTRFLVDQGPRSARSHEHRSWQSIRNLIDATNLDGPTKALTHNIFGILAKAEAAVHGCNPDNVHFHEVGAIDSIIDIVAAAFILSKLEHHRFCVRPLPLGSGIIQTQHGAMPIPAPATALLLEGFPVIDDGIEGERITPTGAAILNYLKPSTTVSGKCRLVGSGIGFGTKTMQGRPNILRALALESAETTGHDLIGVIEFDIDDQSGEDLAIGLERLRASEPIVDVVQWPAIGKSGRMVACVRILCDADTLDTVALKVFSETTTIGLRMKTTERRTLERREERIDGSSVKFVNRPEGHDAKAAAGDLTSLDLLGRKARRMRSETAAINRSKDT